MLELWQHNIEWDEPLSQELSERWLSIAKDTDTIAGTMVFPRRPITVSASNDTPEHTRILRRKYESIWCRSISSLPSTIVNPYSQNTCRTTEETNITQA